MNNYKLIDKKNNPSLGFDAERYLLDEYASEHIPPEKQFKRASLHGYV